MPVKSAAEFVRETIQSLYGASNSTQVAEAWEKAITADRKAVRLALLDRMEEWFLSRVNEYGPHGAYITSRDGLRAEIEAE